MMSTVNARLTLEGLAEQCILRFQFVQQCLRILQIGSVEALGEPAIDSGEHRARVFTTALFVAQPRETHRCAQLPRLRTLLASHFNRLAKEALRFLFYL